ncbi:MAG: hypothetical protein RIM33_09165 [Alphaproteobacteria bacterium]
MTDATAAQPPWSAMAGPAAPPPSPQSHPANGSGRATSLPVGFGMSPEDRDEALRFAAAYERAQAQQASQQSGPQGQQTAVNRLPLHTDRTAMIFGTPDEMDRAVPPSDDGSAIAGDNDFFGEDGLTFGDVIDIINPLQHIPGVSSVYRAITGDEISSGARLAGGTLFGGPIGFASALANTVVEEATGTDIAGNVMAAIAGEPSPADIATAGAGDQTAALIQSAAAPARQSAAPATDMPQMAVEDIAPAAGTSPLFAAQPTGNGPIFAAQPTRQSPLASPQAVPSDMPAANAGDGIQPPSTANTLSPQVHEALMRMAEQSQAAAAPPVAPSVVPPTTPPSVTPPPAAPTTSLSGQSLSDATDAGSVGAPSQPALSAADSVATSPDVTARTQTAGGYIDPIAPEDLPNAMMEALARYEAMSRN